MNLRPPVCDPLPYTVSLPAGIYRLIFFAMEMTVIYIYKWGCVRSFLLYLSELSFVIGITAEKN